MKKFTVNVVKGIITSIMGVVTMLVTLLLVATSAIDFIWSGIAGLCIGTILIIAPDTIIKRLGGVIKIIGANKLGADANDKADAENNKKD